MGLRNARQAWSELGERVDWVYERNATMQTLGPAFQRRGVPWILETNAPLFYEAKVIRKTVALSGLARHLELKAYRDCDVLVCITTALKDIIINEANISPDKIVVMSNGVDIDFFNPATLSTGSITNPPSTQTDGPLIIGYVGKLWEVQGVDLLLEALRDLLDEGLDLRAVIVGTGPLKVELESLANSLALNEHAKFVGQVTRDEVPAYLAQFDVGYSGQRQASIGVMYGSPQKLYEYMAMEKPVIASSFEDATRLIDHNETGYLFEPNSKEGLKTVLRQAHTNRYLLGKMGKAARQQVVAHHSWAARIKFLIESVSSILAAK